MSCSPRKENNQEKYKNSYLRLNFRTGHWGLKEMVDPWVHAVNVSPGRIRRAAVERYVSSYTQTPPPPLGQHTLPSINASAPSTFDRLHHHTLPEGTRKTFKFLFLCIVVTLVSSSYHGANSMVLLAKHETFFLYQSQETRKAWLFAFYRFHSESKYRGKSCRI